jgi:hypothetical protein
MSTQPDPAETGDILERRLQALGIDEAAAAWRAQRVRSFMAAMLRGYELTPEQLGRVAPLELLAAETRCGTCAETARCRRFLAGANQDRPAEFCGNTETFEAVRDELSG